jgi:septal ring factor EnvC (AmiA/AmiB activator)
MTTEERFTRIENALQHAAELHVEHAENIDRLQRMQEGLVVVAGTIAEAQRDLTQAQRQATEAQRQINDDFQARLNALLEAQRETERKLQRWLDQRNNGHGG